MSNKLKFYAAMAFALAASSEAFAVPEERGQFSYQDTEGKKCGQCSKFRTSRCKCNMAKETSPACSVFQQIK